MISKSFKYGSSNFEGCLGYLLNDERISNGTAALLYGNDIAELRTAVETCKYKNKYQTCVFSFSKEETKLLQENPEQLINIIKDLEKNIFTYGNKIPREDICLSWILHVDKGRYELHSVWSKQFLSTGSKYDPVNYGSGKVKFRTPEYVRLRNTVKMINLKYGLSDPCKCNTLGRIDKFDNHNPIDKELQRIVNLVNNNKNINSRTDTINFLKKHGISILREYPNGLKISFKNHKRFIKNGKFGKDYSLIKNFTANKGNKNLEISNCEQIINEINHKEYIKYKQMVERNKNNRKKYTVDHSKIIRISDNMIQQHLKELKNRNISIPKSNYRGTIGIGSGNGSPPMFLFVWNENTQEYEVISNPAYFEWKKQQQEQESSYTVDKVSNSFDNFSL